MDPLQPDSRARCALESVLITAELHRRPSRPPDHEALSRALIALAQEMARPPQSILQKLVDTALDLCQAHSAGISLLEESDGRKLFRWHALAGRLAPHLWGTMPRELSPCGTVLDQDTMLLMRYPDHYYSPLQEVAPRVVEALLIPFHAGGQAVGTLWVLAHDEQRRFDAEDVRVMTSLRDFAAAAYQALSNQERLKEEIAERKRAEAALREADNRKNEFLAILAHELRNPLAPIRNALEIVRLSNDHSETAEKAYGIVERQVKHLVRLVDDLLDVSRITRGKITLRKKPVDLADVVARAVESSRPMIEARKHALEVELTEAALPVEADEVRLEQVFVNLLNNAAKYTPQGGQIRLEVEEAGGQAVVRVRDTGIGIPAEMLPTVFDLFSQVDHTLARAEGGLGIGLTLVRRLTEMHGGTVEVFSAGSGQGSEFVVHLPLRAEELPAARPEEQDGAAAPLRLLSAGRFLAVDGNQDSTEESW